LQMQMHAQSLRVALAHNARYTHDDATGSRLSSKGPNAEARACIIHAHHMDGREDRQTRQEIFSPVDGSG